MVAPPAKPMKVTAIRSGWNPVAKPALTLARVSIRDAATTTGRLPKATQRGIQMKKLQPMASVGMDARNSTVRGRISWREIRQPLSFSRNVSYSDDYPLSIFLPVIISFDLPLQ